MIHDDKVMEACLNLAIGQCATLGKTESVYVVTTAIMLYAVYHAGYQKDMEVIFSYVSDSKLMLMIEKMYKNLKP